MSAYPFLFWQWFMAVILEQQSNSNIALGHMLWDLKKQGCPWVVFHYVTPQMWIQDKICIKTYIVSYFTSSTLFGLLLFFPRWHSFYYPKMWKNLSIQNRQGLIPAQTVSLSSLMPFPWNINSSHTCEWESRLPYHGRKGDSRSASNRWGQSFSLEGPGEDLRI